MTAYDKDYHVIQILLTVWWLLLVVISLYQFDAKISSVEMCWVRVYHIHTQKAAGSVQLGLLASLVFDSD